MGNPNNNSNILNSWKKYTRNCVFGWGREFIVKPNNFSHHELFTLEHPRGFLSLGAYYDVPQATTDMSTVTKTAAEFKAEVDVYTEPKNSCSLSIKMDGEAEIASKSNLDVLGPFKVGINADYSQPVYNMLRFSIGGGLNYDSSNGEKIYKCSMSLKSL